MARKLGVSEVGDLLKRYARQELLGPLQGAWRWVGLGLAGSLVLVVGLVLLTLAMLRALQTETGSAFSGNLSWIPYLLTVVALTGVIVLLLRQVTKRGLG
ncbi:MAG: hypothetical protein OXE79_02945 [Acidimicrobiaceae bacterium]|nr:hypothetical protein [Acidimicrobiaceae bacterium]MCY4176099.1 hypothetical protein [Acidimicrobiaceae bacterium]MCY4279802.1 hypothetical protein [Acidimicrobiaceae bacterium]MCY4295083.1 hypothetical protein [Acidimicrobiaceae bacterium]